MQRQANALAVLRLLWTRALSITDVATQVGLSRSAAEAVIRDLVAARWVIEQSTVLHPGAGRPARVYGLDATLGAVLGVDIGAHKIQVAVSSIAGDVVAQATEQVGPQLPAKKRIARASRLCADTVGAAGLTMREVWIGVVASPGVVQDGRVTHFIGLPGWKGLHLEQELAAVLGIPIVVENDCNLATLAERWVGKAQSVSELVYILTGNRTGAGFILNGGLYRGIHGAAGEIGALPEAGWARAPGLIDGVVIDDQELSREQVFAAARKGDQVAIDAIDRFSHALAVGIAALVLTLDPQLVVVGGGISQAGTILREPLQRHVKAMSIIREPEIVFSELGDRSVALGAIKLGLDLIDQRLTESLDNHIVPAPHELQADLLAGRAR